MAKLKINGKEIQADNNKTLLEVIRENNITDMPTLCHSEMLEPFTSCFLCLVDIEGARSMRPSCATKVMDGMVVHADSQKVNESRKMNLELLLSNHYADCYPPCRLKCPANMDIQGYIALASRGLYKEGQKLMKETNPLTVICGRVCARPCEDDCRRQYVDESVDIKNIKRYMADLDLSSGNTYVPPVGKDTGKKVAVIGAGPAGLSVAYFLRQYGHAVTIYERLPEAGGMVRYGIPEYRMPKADLKKEIDSILSMGVEIIFNTTLGKDVTIEGLFKSGYEAVFLGIGAQLGSAMGVPGTDLKGVMQGVDFLLDVNLGKDIKLKGSVYVVGGGNTAIDAARSALRSGADKVSIVYRRTKAEMPAHPEEIEDAIDEGIDLKILNNPVAYIGENGMLTSVKLQKMELGEPDSSGRRSPVPMKGSEYIENVDYVIEAVGQKMDAACLDGVDVSKRNTIAYDEKLFTTSRKGVFAGGDAVTGPSIIISAVAHGRKAAHTINDYLNGIELKAEDRLGFNIRKEDFAPINPDDFKDKPKLKRNHQKKLPAKTRKSSFKEVELGFNEEDFRKETYRCLECGCQDIYECKLKEYSARYKADQKRFMGGEYKKNSYDSKHSYIAVSNEKCINCGLCVRLCSQVQKQSVFMFHKRGFDAVPVPYLFRALDDTNCIACGVCVNGCPVGALVEKTPKGSKPGPFENRLTESHCSLCGDGCRIVVETRDNNLIKVSSKIKNEKFFDNLCERGRFGYDTYSGRPLISAGAAEIDKIKKSLKGMKSDTALISVSTDLTIEEIDLVKVYADKNKIDLYSFELGADIDRLDILRENGINVMGMSADDAGKFSEIYYFGPFDEDFNSVSFRKIIRDDKNRNIHVSAKLDNKYFRYLKYGSDDEMFDSMSKVFTVNSLIVFNLQMIDTVVLKKLAPFIAKWDRKNYILLNSHVNYSYLMNKIGDPGSIRSRIDKKAYSTLVMVNGSEELIHGKFGETIFFGDRNVKGKVSQFVPISSIYEKSGKIIDQFGHEKVLVRSAKEKGYSLSQFFA